MAVTRVAQAVVSGDGTNFDHSKALSAVNVPAGALVLVKYSSPQSGNVTTAPTDTAGNTYTLAKTQDPSNAQAIWYCLNATANAANVITAAFSNGCSEYGLSVEVYTGGTWTYDATNSGLVTGAYTTSPTVSPSLSTSGQGVIATCFGQYDWPRAGNSATQTPGSIVNSGGDGTTVVMASGEIINSSAFSGTVSVNIQQGTPANTKVDLIYTSFLAASGSSNSVAGTSTLGPLTASTAATANNAAAGLGLFGKLSAVGSIAFAAAVGGNATFKGLQSSGTITAKESAVGRGVFGKIASAGTFTANATISGTAALGPLATAGSIAATSGAAGSSIFGALVCSGTIPYTNQNTLAGSATFGALSATGALSASQSAAGASAFGKLSTYGSIAQANGATGVSAFGSLASSGTVPFQNFNTLSGASLFGPLGSAGALNSSQPAACASTFAPLACVGTINVAAPSLPADAWYYIQLPARCFYAPAPARSFYALSNPNMTTTFSAKDPGDVIVFTLDATAELAEGETLTAITETEVTMAWNTDPNPAAVVSNPQINTAPVTITKSNGQTVTIATGQCVQAVGTGGLNACGYHIAITCTRSISPQVLVLKGILPVSSQ